MREHLVKLGFKFWPEPHAIQAPTVSCVMIPEGFTWPDWQSCLAKRGLIVAGSFGPMAGKVFRLGHMGSQAKMHLAEMALEALADCLA